MTFIGTDEELDQTIAAFRGAAAEYQRLAKLPAGHRERRGAATGGLLAAAKQSLQTAGDLYTEACYRDLIASGGIANAP